MLKLKCLAFNVPFGRNLESFGTVHILRGPGSHISFGDDVRLISRTTTSGASSVYSPCQFRTHTATASIRIGNNVGLIGTSIAARTKSVIIGDGTMFGPNVTIVDFDGHAAWPPENRRTDAGFEGDADVVVGKNVWVGMRSIILKGVTIGDNSVIGAGSVVTADIPPDSLAAGIPAKVKKTYLVGAK